MKDFIDENPVDKAKKDVYSAKTDIDKNVQRVHGGAQKPLSPSVDPNARRTQMQTSSAPAPTGYSQPAPNNTQSAPAPAPTGHSQPAPTGSRLDPGTPTGGGGSTDPRPGLIAGGGGGGTVTRPAPAPVGNPQPIPGGTKPPEQTTGGGQGGGQDFISETPQNKPVGWGDDKPQFIPDMPDVMPGPTEWEVTEEQTVAGQLERVLGSDSPLLEGIKDSAQRAAAKSGLKNSLMAMTAGEMSALSQAFSIASADAKTFARSAEFNAITKNQFSQAEQAFMHTAMLSEQNFKQAKVLQQEQIQGALQQIAKQIEGQGRLADQAQDHWLQQAGTRHAQNLEAMELNHVMDVERLGVVQDYSLEQQAFMTENQMVLNAQGADLQAGLMDRQFMQRLQENQQQFSMQMELNYQSQVYGLLQTETAMIGQIGSSDVTPEQMRQATRQVEDTTTRNINVLGSFNAAPGGPAAAAGVYGNNPYLNYNYWGDPPAPEAKGPGNDQSAGGSGGQSGAMGGTVSPPAEGGGVT